MILGLFVDGWNHINLQNGRLGGFFTIWHGLLYAGVGATAAWIGSRNRHLLVAGAAPGPGTRDVLGVPIRYPLALAGLGLASVGIVGDAFWHELRGEEQGVARVIGPFHILLFAGAALLITGPLRSAWRSPTQYPAVASLRTMFPPLVALMLLMAISAFFFQWFSAFIEWKPALEIDRIPPGVGPQEGIRETVDLAAAGRVLVTNAVLVAPLLLALRRWRLPFGSVTLLFTSVAVLMSTLTEFRNGWTVLAAVAGGLAGDVLIARLRPSPARPASHRGVAGGVALATWTTYMAVVALAYDVNWPLDLALGTIGMATLSSVVLSVLILPPQLPPGVWPDADSELPG